MVVSSHECQALKQLMEELGIREEDLEEQFVRSGGSGGQKVNKTSTCVMLHHLPTGIQVKCQKTRMQALNRYYARQWLMEKIEAQKKGRESAKQQQIEKIRRQKRRRSRKAKEKMLGEKRKRGEKKLLRRSVEPE